MCFHKQDWQAAVVLSMDFKCPFLKLDCSLPWHLGLQSCGFVIEGVSVSVNQDVTRQKYEMWNKLQ